MTVGSFDIVLGMDWLSTFEVNIVCGQKLIHLKAHDGSQVTIHSDRSLLMSKMISMMKAGRLIQRGCGAYLAYVIDPKVDEIELKGVLMVRNFPDVFPNDLLDMPLDREVEFHIDLIPRAKLVILIRAQSPHPGSNPTPHHMGSTRHKPMTTKSKT
ncbi:hypothetical protein L1987_11747 [Smallanthus sonchifolius]|uniref:Uncharacterized protein n=1 Tax=Smallanthus sonchifolius TaxID=185202 RepID=A0ACB9JDX9_9ASTR|nr:hypothetical protein L1987_11747 [Smallanthus sonchifolius]